MNKRKRYAILPEDCTFYLLPDRILGYFQKLIIPAQYSLKRPGGSTGCSRPGMRPEREVIDRVEYRGLVNNGAKRDSSSTPGPGIAATGCREAA